MNNTTDEAFDETNEGKYVIIKIPREEVRKSIYSYFLADAPLEKIRRSVWIMLCVLSLLIGTVLGAVFHRHIFSEPLENSHVSRSALIVPGNR